MVVRRQGHRPYNTHVARPSSAQTNSRSAAREVRVPDVEDQYGAQLVAGVQRFVLDRVVEDPGLAASPFARFVADAEGAAARDHEPKMNDEADVGDAGVRRNARAGLQRRKEGGGREARNFRQRQAFEQGRRLRALRAVLVDAGAVVPEEVGAPIG